jgi:hypothetical protein
MLQGLRTRLTFVNLAAAACLFVVLGGDSFAADAVKSAAQSVTGKDVKNGSLTGADIKAGSITGKEVKNGSLTAADLAPGLTAGAAGAAGAAGTGGAAGAQGAKGDTGPAGSQGAKGDAGTPGPPALAGLEIVSSTSSFDSSTYKQNAVTCPAGKTAISGGSSDTAATQPAPLAVVTSQPGKNGSATSAGQTPDGWFASMNEESAYVGNWDLTTYAVCANVTP